MTDIHRQLYLHYRKLATKLPRTELERIYKIAFPNSRLNRTALVQLRDGTALAALHRPDLVAELERERGQ